MTREATASTEGALRSLALLRERVAAIPDAVAEALEDDAPAAARAAFPRPEGTLHVVGAGGSSGPATVLVACLRARGWLAEVCTPSRFVTEPPEGATCIVSQGMSPNARLALGRARGRTMLVTASDIAHEVVLRHGPRSENGMLVRVVGPVLATLAAMRFAGIAIDPALPDRIRGAPPAVPQQPFDHIVLIAAGAYAELVVGLRWKLLEALGYGDPPIYGVLQFAHGPFQQLFERRVLVVVLDRGTPAEEPLFARLSEMVVPERHVLLRLRATLPYPSCWFEHDAQLNALMLALLERAPRDLIDWPGKGRDAGLYGLDQ
jgi:creatinine amidohydrolase